MTPMPATHQTGSRPTIRTEGDRKIIRLVRDTLRDPPVADLERFERESHSEEDFRHRMLVNFLAAIVLVVLILAGSWIVHAIAQAAGESHDIVRAVPRTAATGFEPAPMDTSF
jgi:hypothetical protein